MVEEKGVKLSALCALKSVKRKKSRSIKWRDPTKIRMIGPQVRRAKKTITR